MDNMILKMVGEFDDKISPALSAIATKSIPGLIGAIVGMIAVTGFEKLITSAINTGDEMSKLAQRTGTTTLEMSRLKISAELADISVESLGKSMNKLGHAILEAADGDATNKFTAAFKGLGIQLNDSNGKLKNTQTVLGELAERFKNAPDGPKKVEAAMALMGKTGAQMIPLLNGGKESLDDLSDASDELGLTWDKLSGKQAEEFNDSMKMVGMSFTGIFQGIVRDMLPTLTTWAKALAMSAREGGFLRIMLDGLRESIKLLIPVMQWFIVSGNSIITTLQLIGMAAGGLAAVMVQLVQGNFKEAADVSKTVVNEMEKTIKKAIEFSKSVFADPVPYVETLKTEIGDLSTETAKLQEEFEKAFGALKKELAGIGGEGKVAEVALDNLTGANKKFTTAQKAQLIDLARQIDMKTQLISISKQEIAIYNELTKSYDESLSSKKASSILDQDERSAFMFTEKRAQAINAYAVTELDRINRITDAKVKQQQTDALNAVLATRYQGEAYERALKLGTEISQNARIATIWNDTVTRSADEIKKLTSASDQYFAMLKSGQITNERFNDLMLSNKRAVQDLSATQGTAAKAYYDVTVGQSRPIEDLQIKQTALNKAYKDGAISQASYNFQTRQTQDALDNLNPTFAINQIRKMENEIIKTAASFEGMFSNYIFNGLQGKWENLGDNVKKIIDRMIANMIAAQLQMMIFGDFGGTAGGRIPQSMGIAQVMNVGGGGGGTSGAKGASSSGLFGSIMGLFGGMREAGGDVTAGMSYLVGEKRPELFTPSVNGTISPSVGTNITINAVDSQSFQQALARDPRFLASLVAGASKTYGIR